MFFASMLTNYLDRCVFFLELLILLTSLFQVASIIIHICLSGNHSLKSFFFRSIFFNVVKLYYQPHQLFPLKLQVVVFVRAKQLEKKYIIIWYKPKTSNTEHKLSFQRTKPRWYLSEIKNLERYCIIGHKLDPKEEMGPWVSKWTHCPPSVGQCPQDTQLPYIYTS